jgi:uncharacterized protein (DUF924 family)
MHPSIILNFWFSKENNTKWFIKSEDFDSLIIKKFSTIYNKAAHGNLESWEETSDGILALIIILDQFPRNMFRTSTQSFATDAKALTLAKGAIAKGMDKELAAEQQRFLYMPFMHSENLKDQDISVALFAKDKMSYNYAVRHREIIQKFGRFPHRNNLLGRKSTKEEIDFLETPDSSF